MNLELLRTHFPYHLNIAPSPSRSPCEEYGIYLKWLRGRNAAVLHLTVLETTPIQDCVFPVNRE